MNPAESSTQQPCTHCGDCARACPEALDPAALFFAATADDWPALRALRLADCSECNRCVGVCPSHIPLVAWFRWSKPELHERDRADATRVRVAARNARLARERAERGTRRGAPAMAQPAPVRTLSHAEVLAAIARGRAKKHAAR